MWNRLTEQLELEGTRKKCEMLKNSNCVCWPKSNSQDIIPAVAAYAQNASPAFLVHRTNATRTPSHSAAINLTLDAMSHLPSTYLGALALYTTTCIGEYGVDVTLASVTRPAKAGESARVFPAVLDFRLNR